VPLSVDEGSLHLNYQFLEFLLDLVAQLVRDTVDLGRQKAACNLSDFIPNLRIILSLADRRATVKGNTCVGDVSPFGESLSDLPDDLTGGFACSSSCNKQEGQGISRDPSNQVGVRLLSGGDAINDNDITSPEVDTSTGSYRQGNATSGSMVVSLSSRDSALTRNQFVVLPLVDLLGARDTERVSSSCRTSFLSPPKVAQNRNLSRRKQVDKLNQIKLLDDSTGRCAIRSSSRCLDCRCYVVSLLSY
jgi:hypothetical protein